MLLFHSFTSSLYQIRIPLANALNHTLKLSSQNIIQTKTEKKELKHIPSEEKREETFRTSKSGI